MAEDMIEEEEFVEEAPLSAEELFEQHKAEINAAFEEKSFFRRMKDMFSGLSQFGVKWVVTAKKAILTLSNSRIS